jgi:hypothetical protein
MPIPAKQIFTAAVLLCGLGFPKAADACKNRLPKTEILSTYSNVIVASVKNSKRVKDVRWNTWKITAKGTRNIDGLSKLSVYTFNASLSSSGCGQTKLPAIGEKWIIYLDKSKPQKVIDAFPLVFIKEYDSRLSAID